MKTFHELCRRHVLVIVCILLTMGVLISLRQEYVIHSSIQFVGNIRDSWKGIEDTKLTDEDNQDILERIIVNSRISSTVANKQPAHVYIHRSSTTKCGDFSNKNVEQRFGKVTSNMNKWSFQTQIECPVNIIKDVDNSTIRRKLTLECTNDSVSIRYLDVPISDSVHTMDFGDPCLDRYIRKCGMDGKKIPNVVHYVWYMRGELNFVPFLSLLGVIRFIRPCAIVFHGAEPYGKYWDAFIELWPDIIILKRDPPQVIFGQHVKHREHSSDVMRIEALINYGGIYMDTDTLLVRSVDSLRNHPCVMSNQSSGLLGSAYVMSERNGSFVQKWMDGYRYNYMPEKYTYNAMGYPNKIAKAQKDIIHIEYGTISRPIGLIGGKIYHQNYTTTDWSYIYGIHLYSRIYKKPWNETTIRDMNTTVGSICRHIYYGNKEMCM